MLIDYKCDPLYEDDNKWTVLHNVCRNGYIELVRYFMSNPFQMEPLIHKKNKEGTTPLDFSKQHGYTDITIYLENIINLVKSKIQACYHDQDDFKTAQGIIFIVGVQGAYGTARDVENVERTFKQLNFAVYVVRNPTAEELATLMKAAGDLDYPLRYKYVAFYFAGHGGIDKDGKQFIVGFQTEDSQKTEVMHIDEYIINPLKPLHDKNKSRLFFFDCCQSEGEGVEFFSRAKPPPGQLVAFASNIGQKSWGDKKDGGIWTRHLCENLRRYKESITDILAQTYDDVVEKQHDFQQPLVISSIGRKILNQDGEHFPPAISTKRRNDQTPQPTTTPSSQPGILDYRPYLEEAAKSGTVRSKITSIGIFGASGVGKTSLLRLLKGKKPVKEHNSTPVARPLRGIWLVSLGDKKWIEGSSDTLHKAIANSIQQTMKKDEGSSSTQCKGTYDESPQTKKRKMETDTSLPTSPSSSPAASSQAVNDLPATKLVATFLESRQDQTIEGFHFLNVTDSGGQAPYIDIAPSLFPYNLLNLVVFKLTEPLKSEITFNYSIKGKLVSSEKRKITTEQLITATFSSKSKIHKPEMNGLSYSESFERPQFMAFGTYYDEYKKNENIMETLEKKNEILKVDLKDFSENLIKTKGEKIIFPLNTLSRNEETEKMAQVIRRLASCYYAEVEVPVTWYLFQIAIEELKQKNEKIIPFSTFSDIGKKHNMNEEETKHALSYLHDLNICLYYPEILPLVVFTSPQYFFESISEIVAVSLGEEQETFHLDEKTQNQLINEGIFTKSLLAKLCIEFLDDLFSAHNFLELMHHLHIITPLPSRNTPHPVSSTSLPAPPKSHLPILYFMPSLLTPIDDPIPIHPDNPIPIHPDNIEPLLLTWDNTVPNGLFIFLISWLIHPSRLQLKRYEDDEEEQLLQQYRNKITLVYCKDVAYEIIMFECPAFIGLQLRNTCTRPQSDIIKQSPAVFKMVSEGIQSIVNDRKWHSTVTKPEKGYLCKIRKCKLKRLHMCYLKEESTCVACRGHRMNVTDAHMVWFKGTEEHVPLQPRKRNRSDMNESACGTKKKYRHDKEQDSRSGNNKSSDKQVPLRQKRNHSDMNETGGTAKKYCHDKEQGSRNNMGKGGKNKSSGSILNKVPSLSDAFKLLKKKSADWDDIGRALDSVSGKDTSNERKGLHKGSSLDNSARLEDILNRWLQQGGASSTWGQLMEALKEDYLDVVNNIEKFLGPAGLPLE